MRIYGASKLPNILSHIFAFIVTNETKNKIIPFIKIIFFLYIYYILYFIKKLIGYKFNVR
jgi:hypothetical protein